MGCLSLLAFYRELRWWLRCKIKGYPHEVYKTISPHEAPPSTLERLRRRVLSGDWKNDV